MEMQRREFIKYGLAAAGTAAIPNILRAGSKEKIRMGFIGVGNRGTQLMHTFMCDPRVEVTALCDVYEPNLRRDESAFDPKFTEWRANLPHFVEKDGSLKAPEAVIAARIKAGTCRLYTDYRALLADPKVDAVCIGTPDHWHAIQTIDAIKAGKDVYCEKPLTVTIAEGRAMVNAQKGSRQIVAVGLNRRGNAAYQALKKAIDSGVWGEFRTGRAARVSNIFPNGIGVCPESEPPKGLDWDKWLGPRAYRPYKYTTAPYYFRWHPDFSSQVGNWGVHYLDAMRWMMDETAPRFITAVGGKYYTPNSDSEIPDTMFCLYEFADGKVMEFNVFEGGRLRPIKQREVELASGNATVYANEDGWSVEPADRKEFRNPPATFAAVEKEFKGTLLPDGSSGSSTAAVITDFLDRVLDRNPKVLCSLEDGHRSTSFAHLANIAHTLGRRLEWDAEAERFIGCEEANKLLHYNYRPGYKLG